MEHPIEGTGVGPFVGAVGRADGIGVGSRFGIPVGDVEGVDVGVVGNAEGIAVGLHTLPSAKGAEPCMIVRFASSVVISQ